MKLTKEQKAFLNAEYDKPDVTLQDLKKMTGLHMKTIKAHLKLDIEIDMGFLYHDMYFNHECGIPVEDNYRAITHDYIYEKLGLKWSLKTFKNLLSKAEEASDYPEFKKQVMPQKRKAHNSYVYIMEVSDGSYKVGCSDAPLRRCKELTRTTPHTYTVIYTHGIECLSGAKTHVLHIEHLIHGVLKQFKRHYPVAFEGSNEHFTLTHNRLDNLKHLISLMCKVYCYTGEDDE